MATRIEVLKTYKIYIDGKFPRTESGRYYILKSSKGESIANICNSSRKDFRDAVVAARRALAGWSGRSAYNRGQILYRIAEMLESRRAQFVAELLQQGSKAEDAEVEVSASIDRILYYAGWADKFQQIFSSVNPVEGSYFNFSVPEPTGVVAVMAPESYSLIGFVSSLLPALVGGNTVIVLASKTKPLCAVSFAEVLNSSDVPGGVINILTGDAEELADHFSTHMDVNSVVVSLKNDVMLKKIQLNAAGNVKRVIEFSMNDWFSTEASSPYHILDCQEIKTTWHPMGV